MRRLATAFAVLFLFVGLTACSSPEEKLVGHIEKMAKIVEDNKDDCKKMETEMAAYEKDNKAEVEELKKKIEEKSESEREESFKKYEDRMKKAMGTMMEGAMKCAFKGMEL